MKKELVIIVILVLLLPLVMAVNDSDNLPGEVDKAKEVEETSKEVKEGFENVSKGVKEGTEKALKQKVDFSNPVARIVEVAFAVKAEEVTYQLLVILMAVFVMLFLILHSIMGIMPFFEGWRVWIGSLLVTGLVGVSGGIRSVAIFFLNLGNLFGILETWSPLTIMVALVISGVLIWAASFVSRVVKRRYGLLEAEEKGSKIAQLGAEAEAAEERFS